MKELQAAINKVHRFNKMDFETFIKHFEEYKKVTVPKDLIEEWKFTGLNNVDFFKMYDGMLDQWDEKE